MIKEIITLFGKPETVVDKRHIIDYVIRTMEEREKSKNRMLSQGPPSLPENLSTLKIGDSIFIKAVKWKNWAAPCWEGPHQVVLYKHAAIKITYRYTWRHKSNCKRLINCLGKNTPSVLESEVQLE